jgi:hypothetical protein
LDFFGVRADVAMGKCGHFRWIKYGQAWLMVGVGISPANTKYRKEWASWRRKSPIDRRFF